MKFRKKPITIEAEKFDPVKKPWPKGVEQFTEQETETVDRVKNTWFGWRVETLEGPVRVKPGDWIVIGIQGEKYPVKPDIFEATYEPAEEVK